MIKDGSSMKKVVVYIPAYNEEATIGRIIDTIKETYRERKRYTVEVIVVNDGSTDESSRVAKTFKGIILIEQENKGRAVARNRGLFGSSGEIIAFTDADCLPRPDWLEKLVFSLLKENNPGLVSGSIILPWPF